MADLPYRVEFIEGRWHLYLRNRTTGEWYRFADYESDVTARMVGIRATQKAPTTEDGWRNRRRQMRSI